MKETPISRLRWGEFESAEQVGALLTKYRHVEIQLPPDFHHVLFSRLRPGAELAGQEQLDVSGDGALIDTIAGIRGLKDLAILKELIAQTGATVHLISPVPLVILRLPESPAPRK
jgi:hypothetical protein